jgi:2,3-diketo-5-methylthio-1-phosphopentane phosphatase
MDEKISLSGLTGQSILVSDFDGTMTRFDFYDLVCREFPEILRLGAWEQYEAGEITHFEALRRMFAAIRSDEGRLLDIIRRMELEPRLGEAVVMLNRCGWNVVVASAGSAWYIDKLLAGAGVSVPVYSNPGRFTPQQGLEMSLPQDKTFMSPDLGVNKVAVVRDALKRSSRVAFAGDGKPDLAPALLVPPGLRFAKSWLAKKLREINEDYRPFDHWFEVAQALALEEGS